MPLGVALVALASDTLVEGDTLGGGESAQLGLGLDGRAIGNQVRGVIELALDWSVRIEERLDGNGESFVELDPCPPCLRSLRRRAPALPDAI